MNKKNKILSILNDVVASRWDETGKCYWCGVWNPDVDAGRAEPHIVGMCTYLDAVNYINDEKDAAKKKK